MSTTAASEETIQRLKEQAAEQAEKEQELIPLAGDSEPEKAKTPKESTREYIVFQQGANVETWVEIVRPVAASASAAIASLGSQLKDGTTYAAIPARNFHAVTVAIETTTSVKLK